ncbi:MAG: hypothetical protein RBU21_21415 [FCB group bacterium]|nr:hypothetical protein [FCB group bacterium]
MPLSQLASDIYDVLRPMVPNPTAEITYHDLVTRLGSLPAPNQNLQPRDHRLDEALGEIVTQCRARHLPALPAIVVRSDERVPGPGYYPMAHPDVADDQTQAMIAWGNEIQQVRRTTYPQTL